jgi:hypothetical protein
MSLRHIAGGIFLFPAMLAAHLVWLSGVVLHFFTAFVAFTLAGPATWQKIVSGIITLAFPILGEIAVAIWSWMATGNVWNGYTGWLFLWLGFAAAVGVLFAIGFLLARD